MYIINRTSFRVSVLRLRVFTILLLISAGFSNRVSAQTFTSTPVTTAQVGTAYTYSAIATDPANQVLTFTAPTLPSWLTFSANGQNTAVAFGTSTGAGIGGVAGDAAGNVYIADLSGSNINKIAPDGTTSVFAPRTANGNTYGLVVVGNYLYIAYYGGNASLPYITRIALDNPSAGQQTVYPGTSPSNGGVLSMVENGGYLYCAVYATTKIVRIRLSDFQVSDYITSGIPSVGPFGVGFSPAGDLYIATWSNGKILKWNGTALSTVLTIASISISDIKFDNSGYVYVSLYGGGIRKYTSDFSSFVTVASGTAAWGMSLTPTGALVYGNGAQAYKIQTGAVLSGTPAIADIGVHNVVLSATNGTTSVGQSFSVTVTGPPTISNFTAIASNVGAVPFTITNPTSNSAGAFTYASSDATVATISGNTITITGAGTATITATQAANGLYSSGTITTVLTVANTVNPTLTFNNIIKTYGNAAFALAPTSNSSGTFTYTSSNTAVATISGSTVTIIGQGTATITANQAAAAGYNTGSAQATLTVNKQAITITAAAKSKVYGSTDPALTYSITSGTLVTGDAFSGALIRAAGNGVNTYAISQNTLALSANYALTYVGANFTITPAPLTITANNQSRNYGQANPALTASYNGLVNGDLATNLTTPPTVITTATTTSLPGSYTITATGAVSSNYTISYVPGNLTVVALTNATLSSLTINSGALSPAFATGTLVYTASVGNAVTSVTVTPTVTDATATVKVNGTTVASGASSAPVNLTVGPNVISTVVTAQDGVTKITYSVTVTRAPSNNANLAYLAINSGSLSPGFSTNTMAYTAAVNNSNSTITLTPTLAATTATITINGTSVSNNAGVVIPLSVGDNTITTVVTAQDGITKQTYTIVIHRGIAEDAVFATNILTPNGDGKNDTWVIKDIALYPDNTVSVYDRAGRMVYSKKGYTNDWTGAYNGSALSEDTYYYVIDLGPDMRKFRGYVTILRNRK